jgi:hypothetical protein
VFHDDNDAINFAIRKLYHDLVYRAPADSEVSGWAGIWRAQGGNAVLKGMLGAPEVQQYMTEMQKLLGSYGGRTAPAQSAPKMKAPSKGTQKPKSS